MLQVLLCKGKLDGRKYMAGSTYNLGWLLESYRLTLTYLDST
jgi:hypothetical protein